MNTIWRFCIILRVWCHYIRLWTSYLLNGPCFLHHQLWVSFEFVCSCRWVLLAWRSWSLRNRETWTAWWLLSSRTAWPLATRLVTRRAAQACMSAWSHTCPHTLQQPSPSCSPRLLSNWPISLASWRSIPIRFCLWNLLPLLINFLRCNLLLIVDVLHFVV